MEHGMALVAAAVAVIAVAASFASDEVTRRCCDLRDRTVITDLRFQARETDLHSPVNPNVAAPTDCIPQHLANLPPDPGEAGKLTSTASTATRTASAMTCSDGLRRTGGTRRLL